MKILIIFLLLTTTAWAGMNFTNLSGELPQIRKRDQAIKVGHKAAFNKHLKNQLIKRLSDLHTQNPDGDEGWRKRIDEEMELLHLSLETAAQLERRGSSPISYELLKDIENLLMSLDGDNSLIVAVPLQLMRDYFDGHLPYEVFIQQFKADVTKLVGVNKNWDYALKWIAKLIEEERVGGMVVASSVPIRRE
jgi:hypothetical protein